MNKETKKYVNQLNESQLQDLEKYVSAKLIRIKRKRERVRQQDCLESFKASGAQLDDIVDHNVKGHQPGSIAGFTPKGTIDVKWYKRGDARISEYTAYELHNVYRQNDNGDSTLIWTNPYQ